MCRENRNIIASCNGKSFPSPNDRNGSKGLQATVSGTAYERRSPSTSLSAVIRKRYPCTSELTELSSRHYLVDVLEVGFYF